MARSTPDTPRLRVTTPWRATYVPALRVSAGQRVRPGRLDDEFPGWQWVVNADGLGGWVPAAIISGDRITEPFDTAELTVAKGTLVHQLDSRLGWTRCRTVEGREGWVPTGCICAD